jgi:RHS repeat-associated protein
MAEARQSTSAGYANSYIYDPAQMPIEQVSSGGTVSYLHHDQSGSTRLLTNSSGEVVGKCSYGAYGSQDCEGSEKTPLGYDGQYTNADTGLVYLRAREYDPATGQFMSSDPLRALTREPYEYVGDNPLMYGDPLGLDFLGDLEGAAEGALEVVNTPIELAAEGLGDAASVTGIPEAAERAAQFWAGLAISQCSSGGERLLGNILGPFAELATRENIGQTTLALLPGAGYLEAERLGYTTGREFEITDNLRVSPFGNSDADNWAAKLPHYHRTITDESGNTVPGGSSRWHRPWESGP